MASFRCYDSSDVIAILIMTNFPLYLIQLKKTMWFIGVEVEQETSAPPPKKNILDPPLKLRWQFFPNACLWRRSLCSNLAGLNSEKLYRATFICQYGLFCCMALVSFRLFCKNLGNLEEFFGQMDYRPPLAKNCPYAYAEWSHTYCLITCRHEAYFPILSPINFEIRLLTIANQIIEFCCSYT